VPVGIGPAGTATNTGATGPTGEPGTPGTATETGATGPTGYTGLQGSALFTLVPGTDTNTTMYKTTPINSIESLVSSQVDVKIQETYPFYYCSFNVITVSAPGAGSLVVSTVFNNYTLFEGLVLFTSAGNIIDAGEAVLTTYTSTDLITFTLSNDMRIHMFKNGLEFYVTGVVTYSTGYNFLFRFQTAGDRVANISYGLYGAGPTGPTGYTGTTGTTGPTGPNTAVDIAYTPSTSEDWAGSAPTTVYEALNRIAAALTALGESP
jgi:hypothetical protein